MSEPADGRQPSLRMLNLGCGSTFHPDWVNMDFHDHGGAVLPYDLRQGIPFADSTFDVVYHSHVLEHFTREGGRKFIAECFRALRPGGLLRVAVPDLENIARAYLAELDAAKSEEDGARERHEWMTIELMDQLVRSEPGGEMGAFWRRSPMPQEDFVVARSGQEFVNFRKNMKAVPPQRRSESGVPLPRLNTEFLQSGELHRWMYDEVALRALMAEAGFTGILRRNYATSLLPEVSACKLDAASDGSIRKPDSLFMEAVKPEAAEQALPQPRVVLFSTADAGGAGIAALRLHKSLRSAGALSQMYVAEQHTDTPCVYALPAYGRRVGQTEQGYAVLAGLKEARQRQGAIVRGYPRRPQGLELFSTPDACADVGTLPFHDEFDVLNLHWIANFINVSTSFNALKGRPVVWTLHDMNPMTGGCHHSDDCERYLDHCGCCPHLGSDDARDISFHTWRERMTAYRALDLHIVCPSRWLAEKAGKSSLLRRFPVHVIPNTHPFDTFRPLPQALLRDNLKIPSDDFVVLFAANSLSYRKGSHHLVECLKKIQKSSFSDKIQLLLLGNDPPEVFFHLGLRAQSVGYVDSPEQMAALYNIADAVLVPSLAENFPNVICEAAGCGTPVVAFAVGGIPEMIKHKETGWLAPLNDVDSLAQGMFWLDEVRHDPALRLRCRAFALENWGLSAAAKKYAELFYNVSLGKISKKELLK